MIRQLLRTYLHTTVLSYMSHICSCLRLCLVVAIPFAKANLMRRVKAKRSTTFGSGLVQLVKYLGHTLYFNDHVFQRFVDHFPSILMEWIGARISCRYRNQTTYTGLEFGNA